MKVLFFTNVPAPYRVDFFNELSEKVNLTVIYQRTSSSERNKKWVSENNRNYRTIILRGINIGVDSAFCPGIIKYLRKGCFDHIVICGVNSPTTIMAITWCKMFHIPFYLEIDGGFPKDGKGIKEKFKHFVISGACGYFSTSKLGDEYLKFYGAPADKIYRYPFTSIFRRDIAISIPTAEEKRFHRQKLNIEEKKIILSVGRFNYQNGYGKGYDLLMEIAEKTPKSIGFYIVGDEPTKKFVTWKAEKELDNVHFIGFKEKKDLQYYYRAADVFLFLSRGDVWGLVVNEAMANGLPVISSNKAIAGLEIVKDGYNGFVVPLDNCDYIRSKLEEVLDNDELRIQMSRNALSEIEEFTFENSCEAHLKVLRGGGIAYRNYLINKLGFENYRNIVIGVGQFIPRKGVDIFLKVARRFSTETLFLMIGGRPTPEYLELAKGMDNIRFLDFQTKEQLAEYYSVSNVLLFPSREDIWGLVINEAMAKGLPVVSTDRCIAALELICNEENGYIVHVDDVNGMVEAIHKVLCDESGTMKFKALKKISEYTIEEMVNSHLAVFGGNNES